MTRAFEHFIEHAHSLSQFREIPEEGRIPAMRRRLGTASSGERAVILAALSLLPDTWVEDVLGQDAVAELPVFRLNDTYPLDADNTRALVEAIAIQTQHPEVLHMPV